MKNKLSLYFQLYKTFFTIGLFTFGGGYAMLPMLTREIVEKRKWTTDEELLDYFAIGQCTPGIIAVNTSTFIGFKKGRLLGAISATLGMISPSIIIILFIAQALTYILDVAWMQSAFAGIRIAVCALIGASVIKLTKNNIKSWFKALFAIAAFTLVAFANISPVYITVTAGVLGILLFRGGDKK